MKAAPSRKPFNVESLVHVSGVGVPGSVCANTYVLTGEYPVLIESGSALGYDRLKRNLGVLGLEMSDIKVVLATHGHWDHVSGMERLRQESDADLLVPTEDIEAVRTGDNQLTVATFYGQHSAPLAVAGEVHEGFHLDAGKGITIESIKTPWHTPGSVCYKVIQPNSTTLIAADTIYGFYFQRPDRYILDDVELGKESLEHLREHKFDYMSIGHAVAGFMGNVAVRLEEAQRQFATFDVVKEMEEYDGPVQPAYINPWRKVAGQHFLY